MLLDLEIMLLDSEGQFLGSEVRQRGIVAGIIRFFKTDFIFNIGDFFFDVINFFFDR
jgi:hypothetical protein